MENLYKTISEKARKYVASAIVGSALTLGTYNVEAKTAELPQVFPETQNSMMQMETNLRTLESSILEEYNAAILDRHFSIDEQTKVYELIKSAQEYSSNSNLKVSEGVSNLGKGISKNLYGVDFGKPELQKRLEKSGLDIIVEEAKGSDDLPFMIGVSGLFSFGAILKIIGLRGQPCYKS